MPKQKSGTPRLGRGLHTYHQMVVRLDDYALALLVEDLCVTRHVHRPDSKLGRRCPEMYKNLHRVALLEQWIRCPSVRLDPPDGGHRWTNAEAYALKYGRR